MAYNFNPNFKKYFDDDKSNYKFITKSEQPNPYSNPSQFEYDTSDKDRYHNFNFIHNPEDSEERLYKLDDLDNPNGWDFKELDMLGEMGFRIDDDYKMFAELEVPSLKLENLKTKALVYKSDEGYVIETTRKYVFESFSKMLEYIDSIPLKQY